MKNIRKGTWNTYATTGYTHDVANDQRSAGGVHCHQVRRLASGGWQSRIKQTNGRWEAFGLVGPISTDEGEALFARAESY